MSEQDRNEGQHDPYDLYDSLGDSWGEKILVQLHEGEPVEYYASAPDRRAIREAWPDYYDEPVWLHINEIGYTLYDGDGITYEIWDWDDAPVSTDWEVQYPA